MPPLHTHNINYDIDICMKTLWNGQGHHQGPLPYDNDGLKRINQMKLKHSLSTFFFKA